MADRTRPADAVPAEDVGGEVAPGSQVERRARRVELYMVDGQWGYRRVTDEGEIVQELPAEHGSADDALVAARSDESNDGLLIQT